MQHNLSIRMTFYLTGLYQSSLKMFLFPVFYKFSIKQFLLHRKRLLDKIMIRYKRKLSRQYSHHFPNGFINFNRYLRFYKNQILDFISMHLEQFDISVLK